MVGDFAWVRKHLKVLNRQLKLDLGVRTDSWVQGLNRKGKLAERGYQTILCVPFLDLHGAWGRCVDHATCRLDNLIPIFIENLNVEAISGDNVAWVDEARQFYSG